MFDSTIGRSTILMPFGGKTQLTETQVSVQKLPVNDFTNTVSIMAFGYNPNISTWSPYHGAAYAVVEACAKVVAAGGDYSKMRFSYQEYFERMTQDPHSFGKPLSALLGALKMQLELSLPSIGGKDSMSGTFEHINVPPTLIAFGITTAKTEDIISPEFKNAGNYLYLIRHQAMDNYMPLVEQLKKNWEWIHNAIQTKSICSAYALGFGGLAEAVCKCCFGNMIGASIEVDEEQLFNYSYGSILIETTAKIDLPEAQFLGKTIEDPILSINNTSTSLDSLAKINIKHFAQIYPAVSQPAEKIINLKSSDHFPAKKFTSPICIQHPVVFIPVFPGTNCDYDSAKAFRNAGAEIRTMVFRNLTPQDVLESIDQMKQEIDTCQILMLAGGFSVGDEPDGSGKFIASVLTNNTIAISINNLLKRGGLILGICNGFQALIKSGLLPFGKLGDITIDSPTLFRNDINRHVSQMVSTRVASTASPWLYGFEEGDIHSIAVSHGEGKFVVSEEMAKILFENHQVAFQYADPFTSEPTMTSPYNPNGSAYAIEGIISPDGQILGKMGHSERFEEGLFKNISGNCKQSIFENAVRYFRKNN